MNARLVLDATAFDVLDTTYGRRLRGLLQRTIEQGGEAYCAAVTLAEVCRRIARTRRVEAALARKHGGKRINVVPTDERMAKLVGAILHDTKSGSDRLADAHVVAACTPAESAIVLTADPDDITALSAALPGTRVLVRDPRTLSAKSLP